MPDQEEAMTRNHMIVGLDDSPSGRAALRWAAQHALLAGSTSRWTRAKASTSSSWETGPLLSRFMTSHCRRVIPCSSRALPK